MKRSLITWLMAIVAVLGTFVLGAKLDTPPAPSVEIAR